MSKNISQQKIIEEAVQQIQQVYPKILAIYLFGSFGTKFETQNSDLDLAIIPDRDIKSEELWRLSQLLATKINRDVEIVNLKEASTVFRYQVVTTGTRIYCNDTKECDSIENTYMSMYLRLNEERKEILEDKKG